MRKTEKIWGWLNPRAREGDRFSPAPGNQIFRILKREEVPAESGPHVRFLVTLEGEKMIIPQWTPHVPKDVIPDYREW
jgi:hypothetical protein